MFSSVEERREEGRRDDLLRGGEEERRREDLLCGGEEGRRGKEYRADLCSIQHGLSSPDS